MNPTKPQAVIFDLFHTLCSISHNKVPGRNTHEILGIDEEVWVNALFHLTDDRLKGKITDPAAIIRDVTDKIRPGLPDHLIREAAESRYQRFRTALKTIPAETASLLKKIRKLGYKTALCSNADVLEKAGWDDSPIAGCFDAVVFSCDVGYAKPEREIYLLTARRLGIAPEGCLFVGDGGSGELPGARAAGMVPVLTSHYLKDLWPEKVTERIAQADHHISDNREILILLENPGSGRD
jgi:putative hydrolase of the HAD superfamily